MRPRPGASDRSPTIGTRALFRHARESGHPGATNSGTWTPAFAGVTMKTMGESSVWFRPLGGLRCHSEIFVLVKNIIDKYPVDDVLPIQISRFAVPLRDICIGEEHHRQDICRCAGI